MIGVSTSTVGRMIKQGGISVNPCNMIPISEIDRITKARKP